MRRIGFLLIVGLLALAGCGSTSKTTPTKTVSALTTFKNAYRAEKAKLNDPEAAKAAAEALVANAQEVKKADDTLSAKLGLASTP